MVTMLRAIIDKNTKTWEDFLAFVEFAYNMVVIISLNVHHLNDCVLI